MSTVFYLVILAICSSTFALYEDQIEKFDWRQQYLGKAKYYGIGETGSLNDYIYIASDLNVVGAVNRQNGSLIWRNVLEEDGDLLAFQLFGHYALSVSCKNTTLIRLWDAETGYILGEYPIPIESFSASIIVGEHERVTHILLNDRIVSLRIASPEGTSVVNLPSEIKDYHRLVAFSKPKDKQQIVALFIPSVKSTSLAAVTANFFENIGSNLAEVKHTIFEKPSNFEIKSCLFQGPLLVCAGTQNKNSLLASIRVDSLALSNSKWNLQPLSQISLTLTAVSEQHIAVTFEGENGAIFSQKENEYSPFFQLEHIVHVFPKSTASKSMLVLERNPQKSSLEINMAAYNLQSGVKESTLLAAPFILSEHHGRLSNAAILPDGGLLVFTEDHATQLINKQGNQVWLREESLAHITAVEMVDLPVSEQQATMQEEFGNLDAGLVELFVARLRSQVTQLSTFIKSMFEKLSVPARKPEDHQDMNYEPWTRDAYNLHKMLVVVTSVGKVFGIDGWRGRIVWEYMVPNTTLFDQGRSTHLFQHRTTGHFPLQPVASVLLKSRTTGLPLVFFFDPILGAPLNWAMKTVSGKEEVEKESIVRISHPLRQVVLVPGQVTEKTAHLRPLALLADNLEVRMLPKLLANRADLLPADALFVYAMTTRPAGVSGYRITLSSSSGYMGQRIWHMPLSTADVAQEIVAFAARPTNEHVYSVGRVLGDRDVLYKYVNPNLLAVLTTGVSETEKIDVVHLYLIDIVVGRVIHSIVHRRASFPVSLVVSENWVLYSIYSQRSLRSEFTILELFEPYHAAASQVPSPWKLIASSLPLPSWAKDSTVSPDSPIFSSQQRASNSAEFGVPGGCLLIPNILQSSYILASPVRSGGVAVSITERGITAKSLLFGLATGSVVEISKSILDPRRTLEVTPQLQEEGLEAYAPELPLSTLAVISYNKTLERIRRINTSPSGLESTCLVFVHGLDVFFTQIAPSKTYDLLSEDFDYLFITAIVLGMIAASIVSSRLAARKELKKAWQ